jgi:hypothetical protein
MADVKISALPLASTPLAGTEVLPIVQSATTDQVSVANLTAGRSVSAASLTLTTTPLAVGSGGTGFSSLTANRIPYATATDTLGSSADFTFNGTNLGIGGTPAANQKLLVSGGRSAFYANSEPYSLYVQYNSSTNGVYLGSPSANAFQISNAGGSSVLNLDASGNLGLGVSPSAWGAGYKALDLNTYGSIQGTTGGLNVTGNAFHNGSNWAYKLNGAATLYATFGGQHTWWNAPSGTANAAITFTQAMTLDASGRLGIGVTTPFTTSSRRNNSLWCR